MDFIRGQNTPYFSWDFDFKIWFGSVKLPGLSRNGPLITLRRRNLKRSFHSENADVKCFPSTLRRRNLKTETSLWKRIRCFLSTRSFHSENASNVFRPHYAGGFKNGDFTLKAHQMFSVHTTPKEFKNGGFTLKTHQMCSVHSTSEEFRNAKKSAAILDLSLRKPRSEKSRDNRDTATLSKSSVFKTFFVNMKTKSGRFQIPPFWRAFSAFVTKWRGRQA